MIKTIEKAKAIQARRANSGKHGYSKAVRRFLKKNFGDTYQREKSHLAVNWPAKAKKDKAA